MTKSKILLASAAILLTSFVFGKNASAIPTNFDVTSVTGFDAPWAQVMA